MAYKPPTMTEADVIATWPEETVRARQVARGIIDTPEMLAASLDTIEARAGQERAIEALRDCGTEGVYIYGNVGTGKSHLAACWANDRLKASMAGAVVIDWRDIIDDKQAKMDNHRSSDHGKLLTQAMDCKRLVLDDMGSSRADSPWQIDMLERLLSSRMRAGLQTIITSNLAPRDVEKMGARIVSRVASMCTSVEVTGSDQRRK